VGSGQLKKKIKTLVSKFKYECEIEFARPVKNDVLDRKIQEIDVGILLSSWPENNPLIINHYLKNRKPVIVTNVGTLPKQVGHKECGYVLSDCSDEKFNEAINFVFKNYEQLSFNALLKQTSLEDRFIQSQIEFIEE